MLLRETSSVLKVNIINQPILYFNNNNNKKKLKYKNLSIEIQRMWDMKCVVIPVIIGATGIVSKSLQKYLETIPGQHSIDSLQKPPY
jgi:hypothetical protein